jgi:hypothetical protein
MVEARIATDPSIQGPERVLSLTGMVAKASAISATARTMLQREEDVLIPVIMRLVPEKEQRSFNFKVIQSLGIVDSRMHLVSMYEAVAATKDKAEQQSFEQGIPSLARSMIPRWNRLLYSPKMGILSSV